MKKLSILLVLLALAMLVAGCIAVQPEVVEPSAVVPTVAFCDVVDPSRLNLDIEGLPYLWQSECVPLSPYDQSQPPGPVGLPQHIEVKFKATTPASASLWREPIIYVIPVEQYVAMWDANGNPSVRDNLETLKKTIALKPENVPTNQLPVLPKEEVTGVVDFSTAGKYVDFGTWDGVRMVARMAQDANPITNQNLQYIYQGFAGPDDELFVSFLYPVSTPFLWSDVSAMPQEELAKFNADPATFIEQQSAALDQLADSDWVPPLDTLDEVIGALEYGQRGAAAGPPIVILPDPDPQNPFFIVTAPSGVYVRSGPSTAYPPVALARYESKGAIIGRSADGQWWVTPVDAASGGQGWVSAYYVDVYNMDDAVPVIPPPALPVAPPPVAQPTPVPPPATQPTPVPPPATAVPPVQPSVNFWADQTDLNQGECTTLRWDVQNVQAVWVYPQGADFSDYPTTGQGSVQVCPQQTTTYEMRVQFQDGSVQTFQVTITVNAGNGLAETNWTLSAMLGNQPPLPETTLTAYFASGNLLSGSSGCNSYNGSYTADSSALSISLGPMTMMACSPAITEQEQLYLSLLPSAASYVIEGDQLVIFDGNGAEILRFYRS